MSVTVAYKQTVNGIKDNHSPEVVTLEELFNNKKQMATTQNYSEEDEYLLSTFYDIVSVIRDPEYNNSLEELKIVSPQSLTLSTKELSHGKKLITLEWVPTVAHCSYATQIALAIRKKLIDELPNYKMYKIDIFIKEGTHSLCKEINRQVNDKERVSAALENLELMNFINNIIQ